MRVLASVLAVALLAPLASASIFEDPGRQVAAYANTALGHVAYTVCGGHTPSHPGASPAPYACFVLPGSPTLTVSVQDAAPGVHGFWLIAMFENVDNEVIGMTYLEACGSVTIPEPEGAHDVSVGVSLRPLAECPAEPTTGIVTVDYAPAS